MFGYIAGPELDERIVWAVDDLAEVLNRSDMGAILQDFGKRTRQEDPVVHFYETFLAAYDPKMREARGVYYTPEPVVSYIVRSVDYLLKRDFGLADGLADATTLKAVSADGTYSMETHKVQVLDPATGTGTFLHSVIDLIYETFKDNKGMWSSYVSQHLLPRLFGFELLMAPYAVAHMKLGLQLGEMGYDFKSNERLGVYLTNTLEEGFEGRKLPFAEWLVEEATAAGNVKYDAPVMVVIGNPPYSNFGMMNKSTWILDLLKEYKKGLNEKKINLDDDFIKFIRFGQWRINRTGYGILAFITNNTYINGITHRRMRQSLMETFTDIYILDLHGSTKKKEKSPDGSKDENVFDIQQGVAISIFVKHPGKPRERATIWHTQLYGSRETKYQWLKENGIESTDWNIVTAHGPYFFFVPRTDLNVKEYEEGWSIAKIFNHLNSAIQTKKDSLTIHFNEESLHRVLNDIRIEDPEILRTKYDLGPDGRDWSIASAKRDIMNSKGQIFLLQYKPFDFRWSYFTGKTKGFLAYPRADVTESLLRPNLALASVRQIAGVPDLCEVLATRHTMTDRSILSTHGTPYLFPLYLYHNKNTKGLFDINEMTNASNGRYPNLSQSFILDISNKLSMQFIQDGKGDLHQNFGPEDIFDYMYAVFHSPTYRERYAEFLKIDFPRLPLTTNTVLFRELCKLGERLVDLHLMEKFGKAAPNYPEQGNNLVEKIEYLELRDQSEQGRVYINTSQYFDGVAHGVWEFHVGGYQVCQKWLKDRKGRVLTFDDVRHYQRIVAALAETISLMASVDEVIEEYGGWPIG
jgi:predicted helicase